MSKKKHENLLGQRFNRLVIVNLEINEKAKKRYRREWTCLCDCGNYKVVKRPDALKCGYIKSCGCLSKETILLAVKKITLPKGIAAFNALYSEYKKTAGNKKFKFNLTKEQFKCLIKKSCFYCGNGPNNVFKPVGVNGGYTYNGIDRVDNALGYTENNCAPCCKECNYMKGSLSIKDFLNHIKDIYAFQKYHKARHIEVENFNDLVAFKTLKREYIKNASKRTIVFNLSDVKFKNLTKGYCYYCGISPYKIRETLPGRKYKYTFNGIDRVDNTTGYIISNCVSCCSRCNYMKRNYSKDLFLTRIEEVFIKHRNL